MLRAHVLVISGEHQHHKMRTLLHLVVAPMSRVFVQVPNLRWRLGSIGGMIAATVIAIALMQSLSRTMDYHQVIHVLRAMHVLPITGAIAATILSYVALLGRDAAILRFMGVHIKRPALVVGAFCGSALGNIAGFGPLSGGAIRLRVYGAMGMGGRQVASLMAWITISFGIGLVMFAATSAAISPGSVAAMLGVSTLAVRFVCAGLLATGVIGVWLCRPKPFVAVFCSRKIQIRMPTRDFAAVQLGLVAVDMLAAGAAMWILLPAGGTGFISFEAIFAVATALGVLSHVPGGLGVVEAVVIFGVGKSIPASEVMAALIAYRLIYFFLPLLLSAGLLAAFELRGLPAQISSPTMLRIRRTAGQLAPIILGVVTFTIGIMLMLSGGHPGLHVPSDHPRDDPSAMGG
jgi:phosphatidylglycerol lysyltransferase